MSNQPPLNPDALKAAVTELDALHAYSLNLTLEDAAEVSIRTYLAAAQPEVNTTERTWRDSAEGLDEHALEIAQQSSRQMLVSDGFKTMARHLVTTYELHRQAGTRAAPPVAPPGAAEIMKILDAHKARTTGHVYCNCGQQFKTDQKHRNHIAQQIAEAKNEK